MDIKDIFIDQKQCSVSEFFQLLEKYFINVAVQGILILQGVESHVIHLHYYIHYNIVQEIQICKLNKTVSQKLY